MSTLTQFLAGTNKSPISIINGFSSGSPALIAIDPSILVAKKYLSSALAANVPSTATGLGQVTGTGLITSLAIYVNDATARTLRVKLTIDGTSVFDSTSASNSTSGGAMFLTGEFPIVLSSQTVNAGPGLFYNASFKIEICSNILETDKLTVALAYTPYT